MLTSFEISLEDARFHAFHGVMPQERMIGNEFAVDLTVRLPAEVPDSRMEFISDELSDTVSYADLYEVVALRMKTPVNLLEHLASVIIKDIVSRWEMIEAVKIKITKLYPPIPNSECKASVTLTWGRV